MLLATLGAVIRSLVLTLICDNACFVITTTTQLPSLLLQTSLINAAEVIPDIVDAQQQPSPSVATIIR